MTNNFFKYFISFITLIIVSLLFLDMILLPIYVHSNKEIYLPDVRNMYKNKAVKTLENLGLKTKIEEIPFTKKEEIGKVVKMSPPYPLKIKTGRVIELSIPISKKNIFVPELVDLSLRNALIEITKHELEIDTIMYEHFSDFKKDIVTYQNPKTGTIVQYNQKISLMVSKGPPPDLYRVPDLINLSLSRSKILLRKSGLRLGNLEYEFHPNLLNGTVMEQSLTPGMNISIPAAVDLIISSDQK